LATADEPARHQIGITSSSRWHLTRDRSKDRKMSYPDDELAQQRLLAQLIAANPQLVAGAIAIANQPQAVAPPALALPPAIAPPALAPPPAIAPPVVACTFPPFITSSSIPTDHEQSSYFLANFPHTVTSDSVVVFSVMCGCLMSGQFTQRYHVAPHLSHVREAHVQFRGGSISYSTIEDDSTPQC